VKKSLRTIVACLTLSGCAATGPDDGDSGYRLTVTERSATTLSLTWPSMGPANTYTVDYLTGVKTCEEWPEHSDVMHVTGTSVQITGLTPSTRYHIHVHLLPDYSQGTDAVFVLTLSPGAASQVTTPADYQSCSEHE
jgi:hypothetical protein